jgi:hypothetical protein
VAANRQNAASTTRLMLIMEPPSSFGMWQL